MLVPISLPVDWMKKTSFTWVLVAGAPGAGIVGKNIALCIMMLKQANDATTQRIITMPCAVVKKQDLRKKSIVRVDIADIVQSVGSEPSSLLECRHWLKKLQKHLFLFRL